jgi:hypothetical protein
MRLLRRLTFVVPEDGDADRAFEPAGTLYQRWPEVEEEL